MEESKGTYFLNDVLHSEPKPGIVEATISKHHFAGSVAKVTHPTLGVLKYGRYDDSGVLHEITEEEYLSSK